MKMSATPLPKALAVGIYIHSLHSVCKFIIPLGVEQIIFIPVCSLPTSLTVKQKYFPRSWPDQNLANMPSSGQNVILKSLLLFYLSSSKL